MSARTEPTRLNAIACDHCNKPYSFRELHRSDREFPFGSLAYFLCSDCCQKARDDYSVATVAIYKRATRFSPTWAKAVWVMLSQSWETKREREAREYVAKHCAEHY